MRRGLANRNKPNAPSSSWPVDSVNGHATPGRARGGNRETGVAPFSSPRVQVPSRRLPRVAARPRTCFSLVCACPGIRVQSGSIRM